MRIHTGLKLLLACLAVHAAQSASAFVVDTGPGESSGGSAASLFDSRPQQLAFQQLAAQFTVTETSQVESVAGWMYWSATGSLSFAIHSDVFASATPGGVLYSTVAVIEETGSSPDWRGVTGLNWSLTPGQYWLVFSDVAGDSSQGSMPSGAALPLLGYAFDSNASNGWVRTPSPFLDFGVRINVPIPEPSTAVLMLAGVAALVARLRRRGVNAFGIL